MKLTDKLMEMIISGVIKKGIIIDNKNVNVNLDMPTNDNPIKVNIKADNISVNISDESWSLTKAISFSTRFIQVL